MKNLIFLFALIIGLGFTTQSHAQIASKVKDLGAINQGGFVEVNPFLKDTLKSGDTISYKVRISHANDVNLYQVQKFKKIAADTSVAVSFWQSMDGTNWYAVQAGSSPSAYTKTVTATNNYNTEYIGEIDQVYFVSRYYKVMFIAKAKTGFKSIPYGSIAVLIK